jgi:uncharacterized protein YndB with AHSA1/START domain
MKIATGIDLDCSPTAAFAWLDDPERAARWQSNVRGSVIVSETPGRVGTTFRETVEESGRGTEVVGEITEYEPGSLIAFDLRSAYTTARVRYRITPKKSGAHLDVDGVVHFRSVMRLLEPLIGRAFTRRTHRPFDDELQRLRSLCT